MNRRLVVLFVAYYVTLIAMLVASFYPESRVWGLNWWAFFSLWVRWSLFIIGGLAPLIFLIPSVRKSSGELKPVNQNRQYLIISTGTSVICALLFYLLRAKTHFLGDGYTLISSLGASRSFAIKFREIGESLAHVGLFSVLGSDGESTALLSYQIISCVAGILFVFLALFSARRLFDTLLDRLLFVFGLLSGGYLLLFFGYVENYSLFVLSLFSFVIAGLLIAEGKINRWWILALFGLSVFFHVMGVILLPATLYLLISGTSLGQIMTRMKRSTILLLSIIGATGAVAVFYHFYTSSYFFRFAFVPFIENRFTTNGYTMFSLDHILDFMNLLFLLIPGLLLLAVSIHKTEIIQQFKHRWFKFLSIAILSTLGAVFIFDPRLGMPRDWDLFAFAGVPIAVFTFYYLLKQKNKTNQMTTVLIVVLGMLILIPRVGSQIIPEKSLSLVKSYRLLDKDRCLNMTAYLEHYIERTDNKTAAQMKKSLWDNNYLQEEAFSAGLSALHAGNNKAALAEFERALKYDPFFWRGWVTMSLCYLNMRQFKKGLQVLDIAEGINPHHTAMKNNRAGILLEMGRFTEAEILYLESIELDSSHIAPYVGLLTTYQRQRRKPAWVKMLNVVYSRSDVPVQILLTQADYQASINNFPRAAEALRRASAKGVDSTYIKNVLVKYPKLRELIDSN